MADQSSDQELFDLGPSDLLVKERQFAVLLKKKTKWPFNRGDCLLKVRKLKIGMLHGKMCFQLMKVKSLSMKNLKCLVYSSRRSFFILPRLSRQDTLLEFCRPNYISIHRKKKQSLVIDNKIIQTYVIDITNMFVSLTCSAIIEHVF